MKIIISPAKTQQNENCLDRDFARPIFAQRTGQLLGELQNLSIDALGSVVGIKGKLLEETYNRYKNFDKSKVTHGIKLYTGLVYKGLETLEYTDSDIQYLENHVKILSAFYGIVGPLDGVKPYRLDMKSKLLDGGLYKFWGKTIDDVFKGETIINLASAEFSKLIKQPMVDITFKEETEKGVYKIVATYAKQARGQMLCWMIQNQVTSVEDLKAFCQSGYVYNPQISRKNNLIFTRSKNFSLKKSD